MPDQTVSMQIDGLEDLEKTFRNLVKKYPDRAGELLKLDARQLRKDVVKEVKKVTKTKSSSKRSLAKVGSYKISPVKGLGAAQYVEIRAKSPHFHLVEHGHELIINGVNKGFVQGKHMMDNTVRKHQESMPDIVSDMVDKLLEEGGLI